MLLSMPMPGASWGFERKQITPSAIARPPHESEYLDLMQQAKAAWERLPVHRPTRRTLRVAWRGVPM